MKPITEKMMEKWMHENGFTFIKTLTSLANGETCPIKFAAMVRMARFEDE